MATDGSEPLSVARIAAELKVNRRTVHDWVNRGCPNESLEAVRKWRADNVRSEHAPIGHRETEAEATADEPRVESLSQRRLKADASRIEQDALIKQLRFQQMSNELVPRSAAEREVASLVLRVKERLLAAPDEFETRFPAEVRAQCKADFVEFVRLLLVELARWEILGKTTDELILSVAQRIITQREDLRKPPGPPAEAA